MARDVSPLAGTAWLAGEHPNLRLRSEEHLPSACHRLAADECLILWDPVAMGLSGNGAGRGCWLRMAHLFR